MENEILMSDKTGHVGEQDLPSFFQIGDGARITFLKPDVVAMVTKVHFTRSKVLYDFELSYHDPVIEDRFIRTRIHNVDSALVYAPPTEKTVRWNGANLKEISEFSGQSVSQNEDAVIIGNYPRGFILVVKLGQSVCFDENGVIAICPEPTEES